MDSKKEIQHVYLVGAKSLGAYGGYETFVYKLTEYHQNKENIKYHVACKANGDGCMDETKFDGVTKILNGQKLVQGMQVHKQLMLQIMPQRIAAHHLLRLFVQLAIDKDQWLIKIERK